MTHSLAALQKNSDLGERQVAFRDEGTITVNVQFKTMLPVSQTPCSSAREAGHTRRRGSGALAEATSREGGRDSSREVGLPAKGDHGP